MARKPDDVTPAGKGFVFPASGELIAIPKQRRYADAAQSSSEKETGRSAQFESFGRTEKLLFALGLGKKWIWRILIVLLTLNLLKEVAQTVGFNLFIMEEAHQQINFPVYTLYKEGMYEDMHSLISAVEEVIAAGKFWNQRTGWLNPLAHVGYTVYFSATSVALRYWRKVACKNFLVDACVQF